MDWVWIVGLTWLALALPIALLVGHYIRRTDLRDAEVRDRRLRESPAAGRPPAGPLPPASVRHRSHRRPRALHCPECRRTGAPPHRRASGPPGAAAGD